MSKGSIFCCALTILTIAAGSTSPSYAADSHGSENGHKTVKLSSEDLKHLKKINRQAGRLSIKAAEIIGRTLELPRTSPDLPAAKIAFTPGSATEDILVDVIVIDGDIIWVGCMQDPPGVSCSGPCPCE